MTATIEAPSPEVEVANTEAPPALKIVNLTITGKCNLDCPCCYQKRRNDDLDTATILRVVDEIAALGTQILMMPGGEPLLRKDLDTILARAAERGLQVYLASNGTLVTEERARRLKEVGLKGCCVGFEVFDPRSIREVDRAGLAKTIAGIQRFHEAGLETFANLIVTRNNLKFLPRTVKLLVGLGVRRITILRPKPNQIGKWFDESRLGPRQLARLQVLRARLEAKYDLEFINVDCALGPLLGSLPKELLESAEIDGCRAGKTYVSIDSNGDVYPCAYLKYPQFKAGNLKDASLAEIVANSPVFVPFRNPTLGGHCGTCPMQKHCGGCRAIAFHDHGDVFAQDDDCHWGTGTTREKIDVGVRFWFWLTARFVLGKLGWRVRGNAKAANEAMTKVPRRLPWRRRDSQRLELCGASSAQTDEEAK